MSFFFLAWSCTASFGSPWLSKVFPCEQSPLSAGFGSCTSQPASPRPTWALQLGGNQKQAHTRNRRETGEPCLSCQRDISIHFLRLPVFQKAAPGIQPFHSSLFAPSTAWLFKFLFQDLVDSESLLATPQAWSDKKTAVFSQKLLSENNVSNKMKPALRSWKIYYNSPYAHRSNVNTNQLHSHRV